MELSSKQLIQRLMESSSNSKRGSSFTLGGRFCAVLIPVFGVIEVIVFSCCSCFYHRSSPQLRLSFDDIVRLSKNSYFSVNEVEALLELYKKLSCSIIEDGLIHKEELRLALYKTKTGKSVFADKVFDLFDVKKNGVIEFEEFVHTLSVFHPCAPIDEKIDFAFRLYDLRQTGYIEQEDVRQMLADTLSESGMNIPEECLEEIIDKTFAVADADKDGKISKVEWKAFVSRQPALLKHMTLPYLKDVTTAFPSFIFNTGLDD